MKFVIILFLLLLATLSSNAQRFEINKTKLRVVSIDPNTNRVFVCYDYLFSSETPKNDSSILQNLKVISDTLKKYVQCLFELQSISFFKSFSYAYYGPPTELEERSKWRKEYIGEYDLVNRKYLRYPALKPKQIR